MISPTGEQSEGTFRCECQRTEGPRQEPAPRFFVRCATRALRAPQCGGAAAVARGEDRHMRRKRMQSVLMSLGLGAMLTVGMGPWGVASAASQASAHAYAGQIREIKIDQCGLELGTCAGSMVLAQAGGQEVDLAIPAGTPIQRGNQRVHLEELGIGNYVMVRATPLPNETTQIFGMEGQVPRDGGSQVGTNMGERPPTLQESNEN